MGKKLLIVRHAKSDWGSITLKDFDRPLNQRGENNAPEMGKRLLEKNIIPDEIISSPALRALTTCKLITRALKLNEEAIKTNDKIYEATYQTLLSIINQFDNDKNLVALFGHNNGITDLTVYLTGADIFNIPTCGMVLIEFPFDNWNLVNKTTGTVLFFDFPKNLEG